MFFIGVIVAYVPEGLLATVTVSLQDNYRLIVRSTGSKKKINEKKIYLHKITDRKLSKTFPISEKAV